MGVRGLVSVDGIVRKVEWPIRAVKVARRTVGWEGRIIRKHNWRREEVIVEWNGVMMCLLRGAHRSLVGLLGI